jgi:hypothetical protein
MKNTEISGRGGQTSTRRRAGDRVRRSRRRRPRRSSANQRQGDHGGAGMWLVLAGQAIGTLLTDDHTLVEGRGSRGPSKCSGSHSVVRPRTGSPNSGGRKLGHNFEPTQAGPCHRERDTRHKSPAQTECSRFQPQAPTPLKGLRAQAPRGFRSHSLRRSEGLSLGRSRQEGSWP